MTTVESVPKSTTPPAWRRIVWLVVRVLFVVGVFVFLFRTAEIDPTVLGQQFRQVRWWWVLMSFGIWVFAIWVASFRWKILLDVVKAGHGVGTLFAFNLVGIFYAQFLPGMLGGEVAKGYYLARDGDEKIKVMSSALVDRLIGITINGLLGLVALVASPLVLQTFELQAGTLGLGVVAVVVVLGVMYAAVLFIERFEAHFPASVRPLWEPIKLYARHPVALAGASAVNLLYFALWALALWAMAAATGLANLGYTTMLLVLALANVAQFLPISINGAGVREGAIVLLLGAYAVPDEQALVFALLIPIVALGMAVVGGVLVLMDYRPATASPSQVSP